MKEKQILKTHGLQLITIIIIFLVCFLFAKSSISNTFDNKLYDSYLDLTASGFAPSEKIILVLLDQESLNWAQENRGWSWPWPRSAYGEILEYFALANADAVCFDVLFSESSVYGPEDDEAFASSATTHGNAIQAFHFTKPASANSNASASPDAGYEIETKPLQILQDSAAICASVMSATDSDGVVRRARLSVPYGGKLYPTLGIAPLFKDAGYTNETANLNQILSEYNIPLLSDGTMYLRYQTSINEYIPYNAANILESLEALKAGEAPLLDPESFEESVVFFGFYAPGLFDLVSTPLHKNYPGVGVHLTMLDTILNRSYISKVPVAIEVALLLFAIIFSSLALKIIQSKKHGKTQSLFLIKILFLFIFTLGIFWGAGLGLFIFGFYLKNASILLSILLSFFVSVSLSYTVEGKQRRYLKKAFGQYVSTAVVDELIANPDKLKLGGERRELTMFFSDLQGFTSISENLEPQDLTSLLNDFLSLTSDIILNSGGTIDKYEGDAIIAFWNAPIEIPAHASRTVKAALECQRLLREKEADFAKRTGGKPLKMRIGMNTGVAVVGNMGSNKRFDYTMLGDAVNLSSRLEGINKLFGTYTLCSEATKLACEKETKEIVFREIGRVAVVGKSQAVTVFEPFFADGYSALAEAHKRFDEALKLFYDSKLDEALGIFQRLSDSDACAAQYVSLCQRLLDEGRSLEDGIIRATEK